MFAEERWEAIISQLNQEGKVRVKDLSEKFQVTEDCIRKDLKTLENAGRLKRTYGGAILSQDYPLDHEVIERRRVNTEKKEVIAAKAVELIRDQETVFLDVSTTNIRIAELLVQKKRKLVVVSNMMDILQDPCAQLADHDNRHRRDCVSGCERISRCGGDCRDQAVQL